MSQQHSATPWEVKPFQGTCALGYGIENADDTIVSVVCGDCQGDDERLSKPNARLIVAAVNAVKRAGLSVESLEANPDALKEAVAALEAYLEHRYTHEEGDFADANGAVRRCTECPDYDGDIRRALAALRHAEEA